MLILMTTYVTFPHSSLRSDDKPPCIAPNSKETLTPWEVDLSGLAEIVNQAGNLISKTGCSLGGSSLPKLSISREKTYKCCNDEVESIISYNGSIDFTVFDGSCSVPVYGIPGCATVNVNIGASLKGSISVDKKGDCGGGEENICATVSPSLNIDVGVSIELAQGYINGTLSGSTSDGVSGTWCKNGGGNLSGNIGNITLTGSVTAGNFYTKSISYEFGTGGGFSATF